MIIGFTGKAQSGKTTCCNFVKKILENVQHVNFKDGLVREIKERFPNVLQEIMFDEGEAVQTVGDLFVQKPPLMRALLQNYGTDVRRKDDIDYWVKQWKHTVTYSKFNNIVCDDVRFLNEAAAVKDFDGIIIRVKRTDVTDTGNHPSETEMDRIQPDYTVEAGPGEQEKLRDQLVNIINNDLPTVQGRAKETKVDSVH